MVIENSVLIRLLMGKYSTVCIIFDIDSIGPLFCGIKKP